MRAIGPLLALLTLANAALSRGPAPPLSPSLRAPPRPPPMELGQALSTVGARPGGLPKEVSAALSTSKRLGAAQASLLTELADATGAAGTKRDSFEKAKDTLNAMMEETVEELDTALLNCKQTDAIISQQLDSNTALRASLAEDVATARAEIADAQREILTAKQELEDVNVEAQENGVQCASSLDRYQDQIDLLESDFETAQKVEKQVSATCAASLLQRTASVVQCGSDAHKTFHFKDVMSLTNKFRSPAALVAAQRAAKLAVHAALGEHAYGKTGAKKRQPVKEEPPTEADLEAREETLKAEAPPPPGPGAGKCSLAGSPSCAVIADSLAQLASEVGWALEAVKHARAEVAEACQAKLRETSQQAEHFQMLLGEGNAQLAEQTAALNNGEEGSRKKVQEANELKEELARLRTDCGEKIRTGAETLCGIRTIRAELYQMGGGEAPTFQDCEVSDWEETPCSAECGGGEKTLQRTIVVEPDGGSECPPLSVKEPCNLQPCPVDCVMGDWSGWSSCSKDCGGGVMTRSRVPVTESENGGMTCGEATDPQQCNVESCDTPCDLGDWGDWTSCSAACGGGYEYRFKDVVRDAGPTGHCPDPHDPERKQAWGCNTFSCPENLLCTDKQDLIVLMDGSGSLGSDGFDAVKTFVADLFKKMSFGPTATKGGAVVFSSKDQVTMTSPMTEDGAALIAAVEGATWPFGSTETAAALSMADQMLHTTGRTEVSRDDTFVLLITDGPPNNMKNAIATAEKLHERGQVIVLAVGYGLDPYVMGDIATDSSDVIPVMDALHLHEFVDVVMGHICRQLEFDETYTGIGEDYKGGQTQTRSGHTCQNWRSTTPHSHRYLDVGDHNFCRNPDSDSGGIWCYTTSEDTRWEYCDPKESGSLEYYDR